MNCPCSGVYVCAYIVIFLPWPAKKSGLFSGSFSLCPLLIHVFPQRQKHSRHGLHMINLEEQANCWASCIYLSASRSPSTSGLANKIE